MGSNSRRTVWVGGGGGSSGGGSSVEELEESAEYVMQRASYEREVNDYFQELLHDYNNRDVETIRKHMNEIQNALEDVDVEKLRFGGSVSKYTYINGYSDVDILAFVDEKTYGGKSSSEALNMIRERLEKRYPNSNIRTGNLAVTVKFSDNHELQILPAINTSTGVRIANSETKQWSNVIRPQNFGQQLTEVNNNNNGRVIPAIKLYKAINSKLPKNERLSGYHIESLAVEAFKNYNGSYSNKDTLLHLSKYIKKNVNRNIRDSTGQSIRVDEYLGPKNSHEREKRRKAVSKKTTLMEEADMDSSVDRWKRIMEN